MALPPARCLVVAPGMAGEQQGGGGAWRHADLVVAPVMAGEQSAPTVQYWTELATLALSVTTARGQCQGRRHERGAEAEGG